MYTHKSQTYRESFSRMISILQTQLGSGAHNRRRGISFFLFLFFQAYEVSRYAHHYCNYQIADLLTSNLTAQQNKETFPGSLVHLAIGPFTRERTAF
jgi:hypothetical protein